MKAHLPRAMTWAAAGILLLCASGCGWVGIGAAVVSGSSSGGSSSPPEPRVVGLHLAPTDPERSPRAADLASIGIVFDLIEGASPHADVAVLYSTDEGATFQEASLLDVPEGLAASSDGERHTLRWDAASDGIEGLAAVTLRVTATDTRATGPSATVAAAIGNRPPALTLPGRDAVAGSAGIIPIHFGVDDDDGDPIDVEVHFKLEGEDDSAYRPLKLVLGTASRLAPGEYGIGWDSLAELLDPSEEAGSGVGLTDQVVTLRFVPDDRLPSGRGEAVVLENVIVANKSPSFAIVEQPGRTTRDKLLIRFAAVSPDAPGEEVDVELAYSVERGVFEDIATVEGVVAQETATELTETFDWSYADADVLGSGAHLVTLRIMIAGQDSASPLVRETQPFWIGNDPPELEVLSSFGGVAQSGTVAVEYTLWDSSADLADLDVRYSTDAPGFPDESFSQTATTDVSQIEALLTAKPDDPQEAMEHTFVWSSTADLPAYSGPVRLRFVASDTDASEPAYVDIELDNNERPRVVNLFDATVETGGRVTIPFQLFDAEGDRCDVIIQWKPASPFVDYPDLDDSFADPAVRAAVLADEETRRALQIVSEISPSFTTFAGAGSDRTELLAPDLTAKVSPAQLEGALVEVGVAPCVLRGVVASYDHGFLRLHEPLELVDDDGGCGDPDTIELAGLPLRITLAPIQGRVWDDGRLRASAAGALHTAIWDVPQDLQSWTAEAVQVRITPFDARRGTAADSVRADRHLDGATRTSFLAAGRLPSAVATGDLTGNGQPDLVVANNLDADVTVYRRQLNGSFTTLPTLPTLAGPSSVAIGHNADGTAVLAILADNGVTIYRDTLDPGEGTEITFGGPHAKSLAVADVNGDGLVDVIVGGLGGGGMQQHIAFYLQQENGAFEEDLDELPQLVLDYAPTAILVGYFAEDSLGDLVLLRSTTTGSPGDRVELYVQDPDGGFAGVAPVVFEEGDEPVAVAIGDLDGDGLTDLAIARRDRWLRIHLQDDDPTTDFAAPVTVRTGADPTALVIGDLTSDGRAELAVLSAAASTVAIYMTEGQTDDDSFDLVEMPGSPVRLPESAGQDRHMAAGAQANDGRCYLAVSVRPMDGSGHGVTLLQLRSDTDMLFESAPPIAADNATTHMAVGDLTGNGRGDLVFATDHEGADNLVSIYLQQMDGRLFEAPYSPLVFEAPVELHGLAIADLNGSGRADLAIATDALPDEEGFTHAIRLYHHADGGTLRPGRVLELDARPAQLTTGDLDGDGLTDLAFLAFPDADLVIYVQDGSGSLVPDPGSDAGDPPGHFPLPAGHEGETIAMGDLMGDGRPELAITTIDSQAFNSILVARRLADGTFDFEELAFTDVVISDAAIGDLTGDGRAELAAIGGDGDTAYVIVYKDGEGGLAPLPDTPDASKPGYLPMSLATVRSTPEDISILDLAGTGRSAMIISTSVEFEVGFLETEPPSLSLSRVAVSGWTGSAFGDLTGDGRPNLLSLSLVLEALHVYVHD